MGLDSITSHPSFKNFVVYCLGFIMFGALLIGLGPLVPYIAEKEGVVETEYSYLFFSRALGFLLGALSVKIMENRFTYHQLLAIGLMGSGLFSLSFNLSSSSVLRVIYLLLAGASYCYIDLFANVSTIESFTGKNRDKWLQFLHGCFGIGGLLGPYVIYLLEFDALTVLGVLIMCLAYFIFR